MMIATAPQSAGNCTQVGYVADNPGYDVNAEVAPPLTHVTAQTGPVCQTANRHASPNDARSRSRAVRFCDACWLLPAK